MTLGTKRKMGEEDGASREKDEGASPVPEEPASSARAQAQPRKRYQNALNSLREKVMHLSARARVVGQMAASYSSENAFLRGENARVAAENFALKMRIAQATEASLREGRQVLPDVIPRKEFDHFRMPQAVQYPFCSPTAYSLPRADVGDRTAIGSSFRVANYGSHS